VNPSAAVTGYQLWYSPTGASGSYSLVFTEAQDTGADTLSMVGNQTSFNYYFYVVAAGTLPTSAPSNVVHVNSSSTMTTNALSISLSNSDTPTITLTGSVPGAYIRTYRFPATYPYDYWYWSDQGNPLSSTVVYNSPPPGGLTLVTGVTLPAATNNLPVTVQTFNSEYWIIDTSYTTFNSP
jgi:hypothetical protein